MGMHFLLTTCRSLCDIAEFTKLRKLLKMLRISDHLPVKSTFTFTDYWNSFIIKWWSFDLVCFTIFLYIFRKTEAPSTKRRRYREEGWGGVAAKGCSVCGGCEECASWYVTQLIQIQWSLELLHGSEFLRSSYDQEITHVLLNSQSSSQEPMNFGNSWSFLWIFCAWHVCKCHHVLFFCY
jgi:hypothetical protein